LAVFQPKRGFVLLISVCSATPRIRHFLEVVLEVKRARYCDIKSKTEEKKDH
jgi:hypothetical protein